MIGASHLYPEILPREALLHGIPELQRRIPLIGNGEIDSHGGELPHCKATDAVDQVMGLETIHKALPAFEYNGRVPGMICIMQPSYSRSRASR